MDKNIVRIVNYKLLFWTSYFPSRGLNFVLCKVGGDGVEIKDPRVASPHLNNLWLYFNFISLIGFCVDHKLIKIFIRILGAQCVKSRKNQTECTVGPNIKSCQCCRMQC